MDGQAASRKCEIDDVQQTSETLTGRAGLAPYVAYLKSHGLPEMLAERFSDLRKSGKGIRLREALKQILCFFMDGTNLSISHFDQLAEDEGYGSTIETPQEDMASSHQIKRLLGKFDVSVFPRFRSLLRRMFRWRLRSEQPDVVLLNVDTMIMDNDDAQQREGVEPTYKQVKGFQPLQLSWGPYLADAILRGGSKHGNCGTTVASTLTRVVRLIREALDPRTPIIVLMDAGFMDEGIFSRLEELDVGYVATGKLYEDVCTFAESVPQDGWAPYSNEKVEWEITSFGNRRGSWKRFRRLIYLRRVREKGGQRYLPGMRPETAIYTNLGMGMEVDRILQEAGREDWTAPARIARLSHGRGADELTWRAEKDFGSEKLPFQRFYSNAAFYYLMLIALNAYEAFKRDACKGVVPSEVYPSTFRRRVIDVAGKVVRTGRRVILKVARAAWKRLDMARLWRRATATPAVPL